MIRRKQTKAKSVPDNEVMLTFWGKRMFRQDLVLQGKYQSAIYNPAEAAIVRIYYPPDRDGTWPVPRGDFCQAFHTSLHFILCSPLSSTGQET